MSETPAPYLPAADRDRLQAEAHALAYVLGLPEADRPEACDKLEGAAMALPAFLLAVRREVSNAPAVGLPALWAVLDRPALDAERAKLKAAGVDLASLQAMDPAKARAAYNATLADTQRAGVLACIETAERMLAQAKGAPTEAACREYLQDVVHEVTRPGRSAGDKPLADAWEAYRAARFTHLDAGPEEVLRLDPRRGPWAAWFNAWLGPRAGLEPGRCVIVGARPGAGKTSLAAVLAVDALAVGCPVLFWQMELGRVDTLEHLLAQKPGGNGWWREHWTSRCNVALPPAWADLLTVPPVNEPKDYEADTIRDAMTALARRARRNSRHACKGLVLVDYAQRLTVRDRRASTPQHEIMTNAASMLAKAAADNDLCLVLLSQLTKEAKKEQQSGKQAIEETAFSGADLSRMAHVAFGLSHATETDKGWTECGARDVTTGANGEARLLANMKRRGWAKLDGKMPDYTYNLWMSDERAFHGGDVAPVKYTFGEE